MGNCNLDCCKCIDKKETQFNQISSRSLCSNSFHNKRQYQIRPLELANLLVIQKDVKSDEYTFEDEKNNKEKKYNDNTHSDTNYKDISFKYSKKSIVDKFYCPNNRYDNALDSLRRINPEKKINQKIDKKIRDFKTINREENVETNETKSPLIPPRYFLTNIKTSKNNIYCKYFENVEDSKNNQDITDTCKIKQNNLSSIFPLKYKNKTEKYITYFTDNDNI